MENPRRRTGGESDAESKRPPGAGGEEWAGMTLEQLKNEVPRDPEDPRFVLSFAAPASASPADHSPAEVEEGRAMVEFFNKFGFVVVRVLTPQESQATVDEIFDLLELGTGNRFDRNDVGTWDHWPSEGMVKHGMPSRPPLFTPQILRNRQNPRLISPFVLLFGTEELMISHDRASLFRPTKALQLPSGPTDKPHWRTSENLHLDMDPWAYHGRGESEEQTLALLRYGDRHINHFIFENNQVSEGLHLLNVQAGLNLVDNVEADGGFQCVPGFRHHFKTWVAANAGKRELVEGARERHSMMFENDDPVQKYAIRVPMRAGSMVIWDQRTPHGARPNRSSRMRCAMFLRMFPAQPMNPERAKARAHTVAACVRQAGFDAELTELGRRVFGLTEDSLRGGSGPRAGGRGGGGGAKRGGGGRRGSPAQIEVRGGRGGWQRGRP